MYHNRNLENTPVAHDDDWYYLVPESTLDLASEIADKTLGRRTRLGRYLAGRQLRNLTTIRIDLLVDDTGEKYEPSLGLTNEELAREVQKCTVVSDSKTLYFV